MRLETTKCYLYIKCFELGTTLNLRNTFQGVFTDTGILSLF